MDSFTLFGSLIPVIIALVFCVLAVVIVGIVVVGLIWGLRKGKVRVVRNERNFDDFGR